MSGWQRNAVTIPLPAGVWDVTAWVRCAAAVTIDMIVSVNKYDTDMYSEPFSASGTKNGTGNSYPLYEKHSHIVSDGTNSAHVHIWNGSGSTLTFYVQVEAVRMV